MRDSKAEFQFIDFARPSRPPGSAEPQKNADVRGSEPACDAQSKARAMPPCEQDDPWWFL